MLLHTFFSITVSVSMPLCFILMLANNQWNAAFSAPSSSSAYANITLDKSGTPVVDYGYKSGIYIGPQRNPITVAQKALYYYEAYNRTHDDKFLHIFLNNSDWLVQNSVTKGNYSVLPYNFPWPIYNLEPPWYSAMAHGQALQVLTIAHAITADKKYLDTAKKLLNSFFVEVQDGGATYKTPGNGWWYEEYAGIGAKESRVLNGMTFALLGINEYYAYTHDPAAKYLFDQGVLALKKHLPRYEYFEGNYSSYDILSNEKPAPYNYHIIHTLHLGELYDATKEQIFKTYHDRWTDWRLPSSTLETLRVYDERAIVPLSFSLSNESQSKSMSINKIEKDSNAPSVFRIEGNTGAAPARFASQEFHYTGENVLLEIQKSIATPSDSNIRYIFNVQAVESNYNIASYNIILARDGIKEGWNDNGSYYLKLDDFYPSKSVDMEDIFGEEYLFLRSITIDIPESTGVDPLEFVIDFS